MSSNVAFKEDVGDVFFGVTTYGAGKGNIHPKGMEPMVCFDPFMEKDPKKVLDLIGDVSFPDCLKVIPVSLHYCIFTFSCYAVVSRGSGQDTIWSQTPNNPISCIQIVRDSDIFNDIPNIRWENNRESLKVPSVLDSAVGHAETIFLFLKRPLDTISNPSKVGKPTIYEEFDMGPIMDHPLSGLRNIVTPILDILPGS